MGEYIMMYELKKDDYPKPIKSKIKSLIENWADTFTGHGVINIYVAKSLFEKIIWSLFLLLFILLNGYYMYNSLAGFFEYDAISNSKKQVVTELDFPAIIFCNWDTDVLLEDIIIFCSFNNQTCLMDEYFEPIVIMGSGTSPKYNCNRFNGVKISEKNKKKLLSVETNHGFLAGLVIGFKMPEAVRLFEFFI